MTTDPKALDETATMIDGFLEQRARARSPLPDVARYAFGREIGKGGMGSVMLAEDRALARPVAVKVLQVVDDVQRRRFAREAAIAGRLEHPNIVPLYDAGVDDAGKPYLAMRWIEGETLRAVIERLAAGDVAAHKHYTLEARCRIVLQLLAALKLAHARDVIHRDIKPENVMIGPFGEVFLVDWGIACSPAETHAAHVVHGTPRYMSPEQANGEPLDARSDVYSLSVLCYELLTLTHPLGKLPPGAIAKAIAIAQTKPKAAELVRAKGQPAIPRGLSLVVMQGLEKDREQRWPSAVAMERALALFLAGASPIVCPHTAYARGLGAVGHVLDAWPRLTYAVTALVLTLAAWGALDVVTKVRAML